MALLRKKEQRSPERQALADAITSFNEARAELESATTALADLARQVRASWAAEDAAEEALTAAPEAAVTYSIAQAKGEAAEKPISAFEARAALEETRSARTAAKAAEATLRSKLAHLQNSVQWRRDKVSAAAARIIAERPETQAALDKFRRLQIELIETGQAIAWLAGVGAVSMENVRTGPSSTGFSPAKAALSAMESAPAFWNIGAQRVYSDELAKLAAFHAALMADADAEFTA